MSKRLYLLVLFSWAQFSIGINQYYFNCHGSAEKLPKFPPEEETDLTKSDMMILAGSHLYGKLTSLMSQQGSGSSSDSGGSSGSDGTAASSKSTESPAAAATGASDGEPLSPATAASAESGGSGKSGACKKMKDKADDNVERKRYKEFESSCYLFYGNSHLKHDEKDSKAQKYCEDLDANLVAIETSAENDFLVRTIDVTDADIKDKNNYWALGGWQEGKDESLRRWWIATGVDISWADWADDLDEPVGDANLVMATEERNREWDITKKGDKVKNFICEAALT